MTIFCSRKRKKNQESQDSIDSKQKLRLRLVIRSKTVQNPKIEVFLSTSRKILTTLPLLWTVIL